VATASSTQQTERFLLYHLYKLEHDYSIIEVYIICNAYDKKYPEKQPSLKNHILWYHNYVLILSSSWA